MLAVGEALQDCSVRDLPAFLKPHDVLVFNDTRVIPARIFGMRGAARIELLLLKSISSEDWLAFARPTKRLKPGDAIHIAPGVTAGVVEKRESGEVVLRFPHGRQALDVHGSMPLPPYIARKREADARDREDYQTVYARRDGSVAAPTAGLHFTPQLLQAVERAGAALAHVTLHVGAGTFLPVKTENLSAHVMHSEALEISKEAAATINAAKAAGGRIVAVGTTSCRALESAADGAGVIHAFTGETDIFIAPGYSFKTVDMLLTNFHLPRSTLFMLACAFSGTERMKAAYAHAIAHAYRFYSYGDACLLSRA